MKSTFALLCAVALLCGVRALPTIAPAGIDCGNGLSCASGQTCFSNMTGAGELVKNKTKTPLNSHALTPKPFPPNASSHTWSQMACSPFSGAVFCHDARFSCPAATTCSSEGESESKCVAADGSVVGSASLNLDAVAVAAFRDYGELGAGGRCFVRPGPARQSCV
jgi:hypothetical protein